jgi:crossover junction endodeoxyribonuclease RuvC
MDSCKVQLDQFLFSGQRLMALLLGIDPGSRRTGYGLVEQVGNRSRAVAFGTITTTHKDIPPRLGEIFAGIHQVVMDYGPAEVSIEKVFMARNADSALKLGQARGAAIAAVMQASLPVFEYSARQVKQAVVGRGGAEKGQVAEMVKYLLGLEKRPQEDAADALAIALCHAHMRVSLARMGGATAVRNGRIR